jgi:periplasmic nitrate reductase NapD
MVISGLYLETVPGKAQTVANELDKLDGVEVYHIEGDFKIVLTLEADTVDASYKIADTFKNFDGVLTTCLVYSNFEDDAFSIQANDLQ